MARLIDDIRAPGARIEMPWFVEPRHEKAWIDLMLGLKPLLYDPELPVLLIDNVADYYYLSDQEHWDLRDDFPNLAPPYPKFWAEHKMPRMIHSKEKGDTDCTTVLPKGRLGALVCALPIEDVVGESIPPGTKWILWCELFFDYSKRDVTVTGPQSSLFLCIDADGRLLAEPQVHSFASLQDPVAVEVVQSLGSQLHPTFLAISFLHCRNVAVVDNEVPKPLAKKYARNHGGHAPCKFRTLVIEPLKQVLRKEGRSESVGLKQSLHICRGHFKDYREGRGLFGRYHQLVWHPMTVRGTRGEKAPPREMRIKV